MKKGIVYTCLPNLEPRERFAIAAKAGYQGVEIPGTQNPDDASRIDELKRYKAAADAAGVSIPSIMGAPHWSHPLSSPDAAVRQHTAKCIINDIHNAALVGADTVLLVPAVVNEAVTYEEAWERSLAEIQKLAKVAEEHNVTIALENVWNKFLLSPLEFKQYLREVNSPNVKAYFDCGNILLYGFPQHWIRTLGNLIHRVHVKDFRVADRNFVHLLHGDVPWPQVNQALCEVGYDSYITVELPLYPQCPDQMIFDTSAALTRIFGDI